MNLQRFAAVLADLPWVWDWSVPALGALGEWVGGLGAAGALIYTAVSFHRSLNREREARKREVERLERAQAERVSAWCVDTEQQAQDYIKYFLTYHNKSDLPIYDVYLDIWPHERWKEDDNGRVHAQIGTVGPNVEAMFEHTAGGPVHFSAL